jgi:hypothetical protein
MEVLEAFVSDFQRCQSQIGEPKTLEIQPFQNCSINRGIGQPEMHRIERFG